MAISLPPALVLEKNKLHWSDPLLDLVYIDVSDAVKLRYAINPEPINFDGDTYIPKNITVGTRTEQSSGGFGKFSIQVENVDRFVQALLEINDIRGRECRILQVHGALLGDPTAKIEESFEILSAQSTTEYIEFDLGKGSLKAARFGRRAQRDQCTFIFAGAECAYAESGPMSGWVLPDCSKHMEGNNGCRKHGDQEVIDLKPREHPKRFGGFPGIPAGRVRLS